MTTIKMDAGARAQEIVAAWRAEGSCECHTDDQRLEWLIAQALDAAVAEERARCVKIVEGQRRVASRHVYAQRFLDGHDAALDEVLAELRAPEVGR